MGTPRKRERRYRVALDGPPPADLAKRCAQTWADIRLAAQHAAVTSRQVQEPQNPSTATPKG